MQFILDGGRQGIEERAISGDEPLHNYNNHEVLQALDNFTSK